MLAEQPPIRQPVRSSRAVVVSGHPLASDAGRAHARARRQRRGRRRRGLVHARRRRARCLGDRRRRHGARLPEGHARAGGRRFQGSGADPRDARQPGDLSRRASRRFGTGRREHSRRRRRPRSAVSAFRQRRACRGRDLVAPAIRHAEEGYVLDDALPTTIAEGRSVLARYEAARQIFLPGGRTPKPGDRFVNADYGATLRAIATRGASEFYQGEIAQAHRARHERAGRHHQRRGSGAVPRDRAAAGERPLPRSDGVLDAAAGARRARR